MVNFKKQGLVVLLALVLAFSSTVPAFAIIGNGDQVQTRNGHLEVKEANFYAPDKNLIEEGSTQYNDLGIQYNVTLRIYDHNKQAWASSGEKVDIYLKSSSGGTLFQKTFYTNDSGYVYGHVLTSDLPEDFYLDVHIEAKVIKINGVASEIINSPEFDLEVLLETPEDIAELEAVFDDPALIQNTINAASVVGLTPMYETSAGTTAAVKASIKAILKNKQKVINIVRSIGGNRAAKSLEVRWNKYVEPTLKQLLTWESLVWKNIEDSLSTALHNTGIKSSTARTIAYWVAYVARWFF